MPTEGGQRCQVSPQGHLSMHHTDHRYSWLQWSRSSASNDGQSFLTLYQVGMLLIMGAGGASQAAERESNGSNAPPAEQVAVEQVQRVRNGERAHAAEDLPRMRLVPCRAPHEI